MTGGQYDRTTLLVLAGLLLGVAEPASGQWTVQSSGVSVELRGLSVVTDRVAWASGQRGTVLRTVDGGDHWEIHAVPGAAALDLRAIAARSAQVAHAISIADSGRIFRTTDGGVTWTQQFMSLRKGSFLDAIQFWDDRHGIALSDPVDGKYLVFATDNGGDTWAELPGDAMPGALAGEGAFAASGTCLVVGGTSDVWFVTGGGAVARVFHSGNRGRTWTASNTPIRAGSAGAGIFSIAFADAQHGVVVGGDYEKPAMGGRNAALTSDGGATWTLVDSATAPHGYRSAVVYVAGSRGQEMVAVGPTGSDMSSDGGRTWRVVDQASYNSVLFAPGGGYAVGAKGRIGRWAQR